MSATEKLREMLDERGIKYEKIQGECATKYEFDNVHYRINKVIGGLQIENFDPFTPEQVIAKTVGRETCHMVLRYDYVVYGEAPCSWLECDECGGVLPDSFGISVSYCPNCGRKVVE